MTPRDIFGLIVRVTGFGFVIAGVMDLGHFAVVLLGLPSTSNAYSQPAIVTAAAFWLIVGLILLVGAGLITRVIYGREGSPWSPDSG